MGGNGTPFVVLLLGLLLLYLGVTGRAEMMYRALTSGGQRQAAARR